MNTKGTPILSFVAIIFLLVLAIAIILQYPAVAVVSGLLLFICICVAASRFIDRCQKSIEEDE